MPVILTRLGYDPRIFFFLYSIYLMTFDFKMWGSQAASVRDKSSISKVQI